jgi:hypothetical protein
MPLMSRGGATSRIKATVGLNPDSRDQTGDRSAQEWAGECRPDLGARH